MKIKSRPIKWAISRQALKAGSIAQTSSKGVFLGRAYEENSPVLSMARDNHKQIFLELQKELGALTKGILIIHTSKSPYGTYNDNEPSSSNQLHIHYEQH